jgi:hypothetical protein
MAGNMDVQFRRVGMIIVELGKDWNIQQRTVDIEEISVKGVDIG